MTIRGNMKKRILSIILTGAVFFSIFVPAFAEQVASVNEWEPEANTGSNIFDTAIEAIASFSTEQELAPETEPVEEVRYTDETLLEPIQPTLKDETGEEAESTETESLSDTAITEVPSTVEDETLLEPRQPTLKDETGEEVENTGTESLADTVITETDKIMDETEEKPSVPFPEGFEEEYYPELQEKVTEESVNYDLQNSLEETPKDEAPDVLVITETIDLETVFPGGENDNYERLNRYVDRFFYPPLLMAPPPNTKQNFTNLDWATYNVLRNAVEQVAAGSLSSTIFNVSYVDLGYSKAMWNAEELGVSTIVAEGNITEESKNALATKMKCNLNVVLGALLADCPYELYWFDKTAGTKSNMQVTASWDPDQACYLIKAEAVVYSFPVAAGYSAGEYMADSSAVQTARGAAENAQTIVDRYAGQTNAEIMRGYKNEICNLVSYNSSALSSGVSEDGNPWQMIWVFDNDASTNVVCEGYSKAFQYLCNKTDFTSGAYTYIVTGMMTGGTGAGNHMWNVAHMEDGRNYLVDVTNCDSGTIGYPDSLFLACADNGSLENGYDFFCSGNRTIRYEYDSDTFSIYSSSDLVISSSAYGNPTGQEGISIEERFPDSVFRVLVSNEFDTDHNGFLTDEEIAAVTEIKCTDYGITALTGIEVFTALQKLYCSGNALTDLDLSCCTAMSYLDCSLNQLKTLNVSSCTALKEICCSDNQLTSLDVSSCPALVILDCSINRLVSLDVNGFTKLKNLNCAKNSISSLDIRNCPLIQNVFLTGTKTEQNDVLVYVYENSAYFAIDKGVTVISNEKQALQAPVLSGVSLVDGGVKIAWKATAGAAQYRVFRKTGSGSWTKVADTTETRYTDKTAVSGTSYIYTVRCLSGDGNSFTSAYDPTGKSITYIAAPVLSGISLVNGGVKIAWKASTGASQYRVFRKTGNGGWTKLADVTGNNYTDKTAISGTIYTYTVRCLSTDGKSFTSAYNSTGMSIIYIAAPVLSGISLVYGGVKITWKASGGAAKYRVFRKTSSGSWTKVADTTETSYTDKTAVSGTSYTYTVRCLSGDAKSFTSAYNSTGKSITYIAAPVLKSVKAVTGGVKITWKASSGAEKYRVFRKTGNGGWVKLADIIETSCTDKTVKTGTTYTYTVRCISSNGKSFTSAYDPVGKTMKIK